MKTLNTVGSFSKSKMIRENARRLCRNFTLHIFLSKDNVSTCKNHRSLCVIVHMYTMKLITYGDGLSYRWLETGDVLSYLGLHKTGAMQKRHYISCVI